MHSKEEKARQGKARKKWVGAMQEGNKVVGRCLSLETNLEENALE